MLFVFMSQPDFACNPHALWQYIVSHTSHETAWVVKKEYQYEKLLARSVRCALYDTAECSDLVRTADCVVMNSYTFQDIPKREGQIFVNLWHGSGIKAHDFFNRNMEVHQAARLEQFAAQTDLLCVQSLDDRFRLSAQLHFDLRKCVVTGQPRLDTITIADGREKLCRLFGDQLAKYERLVFFVPSFRANMSSLSGTIYSDNIFRLPDYDDRRMEAFLDRYDAAIVCKLHPVEQAAFKGRNFHFNRRCFNLTDEMLFDADVRYTEILNDFDVMVSDYSSIAFDYLPLDRPIVYLIPDYDEYKAARGFVFRNVDDYMPGDKAVNFSELLAGLQNAFEKPDSYKNERSFVIKQRFDFTDGKSVRRCYETIMNYHPLPKALSTERPVEKVPLPSSADLLQPYIPTRIKLIDGSKVYSVAEKKEILCSESGKIYVHSDRGTKYRRLHSWFSTDIRDYEFYQDAVDAGIRIACVEGGVDYALFSSAMPAEKSPKKRLGFAGTIDERIYFAMVQCICEVFGDCEVVFAGKIFGKYPAWLQGFANLRFVDAEYAELPGWVKSFDVAILPFFGNHMQDVPSEYFQYLAAGVPVVASNMVNLPVAEGVYVSASITEAVENVKKALMENGSSSGITERQKIAAEYDWAKIAMSLMPKKS